MAGYLAVVEVLIVVATGIDARVRKCSWFWRWCYWHLAPLWALWLGFVYVLDRCAVACARRAVERWRRDQWLLNFDRL